MAKSKRVSMGASTALLFLALLLPSLQLIEAQIGVCYGKSGNNLPSPQAAVNLCKSNGIGAMRIYDLDQGILQAAHDAGLNLVVGVPNDPSLGTYNVQSVGTDPSMATQYVQTYVVPYASSIKYIAVGNEVSMDSPEAPLVGPAMQNVLNALNAANLGGQIKVTTAIGTSLVINAFPPSNGQFSNLGFMTPVANFLARNGSPLLLNIYTYFAYAGSTNIGLDYALFTSPNTQQFTDPNNGLLYQNLFDALMDATYAALGKATTEAVTLSNGGSSTKIAASETGWPSSGGFGHSKVYYTNTDGGETVGNAGTYYRNLINHVKQGTPLRPGAIETFLFELFDEDQKPGVSAEQHFGLFTPDQQSKYNLNFI